jgi:glycosyltransferase involved in cell wall biosynthesis
MVLINYSIIGSRTLLVHLIEHMTHDVTLDVKCLGRRHAVFLSILLPVYNAEAFLGDALDSILGQTHTNFEVIIIDDGSSDRSPDIIAQYQARDARIRVLSHENWGMGASLNHAIEQAASDWIVRMDADDIMEPHRLERQIAFLRANPDVGVASCLVRYIDAHGRPLGSYTSVLTTREAYSRFRSENQLIAFHHPGVIMRKDLVQAVGGYRPQFWSADDMDLWNRIAELDTVILVQPEYLLQYRIHGTSVSRYAVRDQQMKVRWVEDSMLRRRSGRRELSLDEFQQMERSRPLVERLNRARKDTGRILYKHATLHYSSGNRWRTAATLLGVFACYPTLGAAELNRKLLHLSRPGASPGVTGQPDMGRSSD